MQRLEVSDAVRPLYGSLGVKGNVLEGSWEVGKRVERQPLHRAHD